MKKEKCNLVLAGGGIKGSFTLGVIEEILKKYDIEAITGSSVGALIGIYLANGKFELLKKYFLDVKKLEELFNESHQFGILESILFRSSLYRNEKVKKTIENDIDFSKWVSKFGITWTDIKRKEKVESLISEESVNYSLLIEWITASMAFSPAFPIVKTKRRINNELVDTYGYDAVYSDGIPVETLIKLTNNFQSEAKKTFIVLCSNSGSDSSKNDFIPKNILENYLDSVESLFNNIADLNVKYGKLKYWQQNENHEFKIIMPQISIMKNTLDFNLERIIRNLEYGKRTAFQILTQN